MAGTLTIDTLKASSGVLATQNGMTGIAKAWVNYNGSTQTIAGSFNVSSVTYSSAGNYTINFSTAMPNSSYVVNALAASDSVGSTYIYINGTSSALTTSGFAVQIKSEGGAAVNRSYTGFSVFSA